MCLPRGSGKTSVSECLIYYRVAYGLSRFVVLLSHDARASAAILRDLWRPLSEPDSPFA